MECSKNQEQMEAIILAAGYSSRAQSFKMALQLGGKSVLEHTVSKFVGVCQKVIIVGGYQWNKTKSLADEIQDRYQTSIRIKCVFNENFNEGMFSSIQTGCKEVKAPAFFITPGDYPLVGRETIMQLGKETGTVVIPSYRFKGGHPIKLTNEVKKQILEETSMGNLRNIIQSHQKNYVNVDDPGVIFDIDTKEDYEKAVQYYVHHFRL